MRLPQEFIRLRHRFDAEQLRAEISRLDPSAWITHPAGFRSNLALILVSTGGTINDDFAISGPMRPTIHLRRCPRLREVLAAFDTPISRCRLMLLGPRAVLPLHDDICYHWYRRVRIHVPIATNPGALFYCNGKTVHMPAGEAWLFDNFLPHMVINEGSTPRIHLVADTRGTPQLWSGAAPPSKKRRLRLERYRFQVLAPDEVDGLIRSIILELGSAHRDPRALALAHDYLLDFAAAWTAAFQRFGHEKAGARAYFSLARKFASAPVVEALRARISRYSPAGTAIEVISSLPAARNRIAPKSPGAAALAEARLDRV